MIFVWLIIILVYSSEAYKNLIKKYASFASWAIWDDKNKGDTSIIEKNLNSLHSKFILLALNFSVELYKSTWKNWSNFHFGLSNVRKLKFACNDNKIRGSYMTDLFKNMDGGKDEAVLDSFD